MEHTRSSSFRTTLEMDVRCRQCEECLKARAAFWRIRAQYELKNTAGRTWFVTLTLRPEEHFRSANLARVRLARLGEDFDRLDASRQFYERHHEVSRWITLYLKRVRKESAATLRYILVAEAHKSGLPHYHMLLHEAVLEEPVRQKTIYSQWLHGFSDARLVAQDGDISAARYVCKYLAKSALARVRSSVGYGQPAV